MPRRAVVVLVVMGLWLLGAIPAEARTWRFGRPDGRPPAGVLNAGIVEWEEWRVGYRFSYVTLDGLRTGTTDIPIESVLIDYPVAPLRMSRQVHLFDVQYSPRDWLILSGSVPYISQEMDHRARTGREYTTRSSGIGDIGIIGLLKFFDEGDSYSDFKLGVTIPTGSIDQTDTVPSDPPTEFLLPPDMQTSSGTWDLVTGLAFVRFYDWWSWGFDVGRISRFYNNSRDYRRGYRFHMTSWGAFKLTPWLSVSARAQFLREQGLNGSGGLDPNQSPARDAANSGRRVIEIPLGLNFYVPGGTFEGNRFLTEIRIPVMDDVSGIQLGADWGFVLGWQLDFR